MIWNSTARQPRSVAQCLALLALASVAGVSCPACVDRSTVVKGEPRNDAEALALLPLPLQGQIGDVVTMRAATPVAPTIAPGQVFKFTYGFIVGKPNAGFVPRLMLVGSPGTADYLPITSPTLHVDTPSGQWRGGDAIVDALVLHLPSDWSSPTATLTWALAPVGSHTVADRMPVTQGESQDSALILGRWQVDLAQRIPGGATPISFVSEPLTIDGRADEAAWDSAAHATLVVGENSPAPSGLAVAKLLWDDAYLYVYAQIEDVDIATPYVKRDDPLWKADVVEIFIDTDRNQRDYVELQVNPAVAIFDSHFQGGRTDPSLPAWNSQMRAAVMVDGTISNVAGSDRDRGWSVEMAIPWRDVKASEPAFVPSPGAQLGLNVVRVDHVGGKPAIASWNRVTYRDFHGIDRLLSVVLVRP